MMSSLSPPTPPSAGLGPSPRGGVLHGIRKFRRAIIVFFITLSVIALLIGVTIRNKQHLEQMTMEQVIMEKSIKIHEVVSTLLHKTQALAALVIQDGGKVVDFYRVAATIANDPAILNILIAPDGIISNIYPLEGNKAAIGHDLFGKGEGNREALTALEMGQLVFGGPFKLVQGGVGLVGRLPVTIKGPGGVESFWGLVSVTLRYPEVLEPVGLEALGKQGFTYQMWRINPDDGQRQVIAESASGFDKGSEHIEQHIKILNADWYFRIAPVFQWHERLENWILIFLGFSMSLLVAVVVQNNTELRQYKSELNMRLRNDGLTGALNRRELLAIGEELVRQGKAFYVRYLNIDDLGRLNSDYGYMAADMALARFGEIFMNDLNGQFFFARIGGDEFVLLKEGSAGDAHDEEAWRAIRKRFAEPVCTFHGACLRMGFSAGLGAFPRDGDTLDAVILKAHQAMRREKLAKKNIGGL